MRLNRSIELLSDWLSYVFETFPSLDVHVQPSMALASVLLLYIWWKHYIFTREGSGMEFNWHTVKWNTSLFHVFKVFFFSEKKDLQ